MISELLGALREKWGIECSMTESDLLSPSDVERLKTGIRGIPPQVRGRIVTSRGHILPFSKTKNLNLKNTPVLVLYREEAVIDVYPHILGSKYTDIPGALERILRYGPDEYLQFRGLLEEPVVKILSDFPEILGRGVKSLGSEISVNTGKIDILLEDECGRITVVEVENFADDFAVGQVCRLAAGYSSQYNTPQDSIRKVLVCLDHSSTLPDTCRGAGVELLRLVLKSIVGAESKSNS